MIDLKKYNVYTNKDGRMRAYNKETHKITSFPRLIIEDFLGRDLLKDEDIHHKDGNPLNNDISNLEVIAHSEHCRSHSLEQKHKYYDKEMICPECGKVFIWNRDKQSRYYKIINHGGKRYGPFCSKSCSASYCLRKYYHGK